MVVNADHGRGSETGGTNDGAHTSVPTDPCRQHTNANRSAQPSAEPGVSNEHHFKHTTTPLQSKPRHTDEREQHATRAANVTARRCAKTLRNSAQEGQHRAFSALAISHCCAIYFPTPKHRIRTGAPSHDRSSHRHSGRHVAMAALRSMARELTQPNSDGVTPNTHQQRATQRNHPHHTTVHATHPSRRRGSTRSHQQQRNTRWHARGIATAATPRHDVRRYPHRHVQRDPASTPHTTTQT